MLATIVRAVDYEVVDIGLPLLVVELFSRIDVSSPLRMTTVALVGDRDRLRPFLVPGVQKGLERPGIQLEEVSRRQTVFDALLTVDVFFSGFWCIPILRGRKNEGVVFERL